MVVHTWKMASVVCVFAGGDIWHSLEIMKRELNNSQILGESCFYFNSLWYFLLSLPSRLGRKSFAWLLTAL